MFRIDLAANFARERNQKLATAGRLHIEQGWPPILLNAANHAQRFFCVFPKNPAANQVGVKVFSSGRLDAFSFIDQQIRALPFLSVGNRIDANDLKNRQPPMAPNALDSGRAKLAALFEKNLLKPLCATRFRTINLRYEFAAIPANAN
jgi:hypothetical protein